MTDHRLARKDQPALFYRREGQGHPVLLIHGVGSDASSWDQIARELADEFQVIRLDLRGHGRSAPIDGDLTLDDFVRDAIDVLDACAVPLAHIVGFSLGGMVARGSRWIMPHASIGWCC